MSCETANKLISFGQERFWQSGGLFEATGRYNIPVAYDLRGTLDVTALVKSLQAVVDRHESLRTHFCVENDLLVPIVQSPFEVSVPHSRHDSRAEIEKELEENARQFVDSRISPLFRFHLYELPDAEWVFFLVIHHLVCDRWSLGIFAEEVNLAYRQITSGEPIEFPRDPQQYHDYVRWQRSPSHAEIAKQQLGFWTQLFESDVSVLKLPMRNAFEASSNRGGRVAFSLPCADLRRLEELCQAEQVTPFVGLLTAYAAALHFRTGQSDLMICVPMSGRHRSQSRGVIGYINNIVPIRIRISGRESFRDVLRQTQQQFMAAFRNQDLPFQQIQSIAAVRSKKLARSLFAFQNTRSLMVDLPGIQCQYRDLPTGAPDCDLSVFLEEKEDAVYGTVDFQLSRLTPDSVDDLVDGLRDLIHDLSESPDVALGSLRHSCSATPKDLLAGSSAECATIQARDKCCAPTGVSGAKVEPPTGSPIAQRLTAIWQHEFDLAQIGLDVNFFDLGGHSLLAAKLFQRIEDELGYDLPVSTLIHAPTIGRLAKVIEHRDPGSWKSLVPIQTSDQPPLFCVHGGGGFVLGYQELAKHLGPSYHVVGLQAKNVYRGEEAPLTIKDVAADYLSEVLEYWPSGPYHVAGHSFGAVVAYEMACQLTSAGKEVEFVGLFDYPGPDAKASLIDKLRFVGVTLTQLDWAQRWDYCLEIIRFRVTSNRRLPKALRGLVLRATGGKLKTGQANEAVKRLEATVAALKSYSPPHYPGTVTVFRAEKGTAGILKDPRGGWGGVAGKVAVHDIDCDHLQFFKEPFVGAFAEELKRALPIDAVATETEARAEC